MERGVCDDMSCVQRGDGDFERGYTVRWIFDVICLPMVVMPCDDACLKTVSASTASGAHGDEACKVPLPLFIEFGDEDGGGDAS